MPWSPPFFYRREFFMPIFDNYSVIFFLAALMKLSHNVEEKKNRAKCDSKLAAKKYSCANTIGCRSVRRAFCHAYKLNLTWYMAYQLWWTLICVIKLSVIAPACSFSVKITNSPCHKFLIVSSQPLDLGTFQCF